MKSELQTQLLRFDTGLDVLEIRELKSLDGKFSFDAPRQLRLSPALKWLEREGMRIALDKTKKRHIRFLANEAAIHAKMARDQFREIVRLWQQNQSKPFPRAFYKMIYSATKNGFMAGAASARLRVVDAEADAMSGSKSRQAAQKRNRQARDGSFRYYWNKLKNHKLSNVELCSQLQSLGLKQSKRSIERQICRAKIADTKP